MTRRESREAAMCLLYEYSYNTHKTPGEIVNAAVENREEKLSGFTRELFTGACSRLPEIDTILTASERVVAFGGQLAAGTHCARAAGRAAAGGLRTADDGAGE